MQTHRVKKRQEITYLKKLLTPTHFKEYGHLIFKKILRGGSNSPKQETLRGDVIPRQIMRFLLYISSLK